MKHASLTFGVALLVSVFAPDAAEAQDRGNPNWYFRLAPYLWFSNLGGSETLGLPPDEQVVGNLLVPVEDTVLERSWLVRAEFGKGRWRGWLNFSRANLANPTDEIKPEDDPDQHLSGSYDLTWYTAEFFAAAQIGSFSTENAVELYAGARYAKHEQVLAVEDGGSGTTSESWVDPVIGSRVFMELGRRFWTAFNTDIGGFSLGSDFTWTMGGELGIRVIEQLDITMRYNYQEVDYDNRKEGAETYRWSNGVQQGWFFGAVLKL
jgi:hypothetical protein